MLLHVVVLLLGSALVEGIDECLEISAAVTCNHKPRYTASGCQCACDWIATFKDQNGMVIVLPDGPGSTTPCAGGCCNPNSEAGGDWCYPAANDFNTQRGCSTARETCLAAGAVPATGGVPPRAAIPGIPDSQNNICTDGGQICVDPDTMADNDWQCQCVAPKTGTAEQQALATCVDVALAPTAVPPSATKNECLEISAAVTCNHKPRYTTSGCQCACDWIATFKDQNGMVIVLPDGPGSTTPCAGGCCNPNSEAGGDWCYPAANDFNTQRGCSRSREICLAAGAVPATGGVPPRSTIPGIPDSQNNICTDGGQICVDPNTMADNDWQCQCVAPKTGTPVQQALATCVATTIAPTDAPATNVPPPTYKNECEEISAAVTCNHKPRYTTSGCQCACDWIATFKDLNGMVIVLPDGPGSTTPCAGGCCNPNSEAGGDWCYPAANDFNTQRGCSTARETCLAAGAVPATGGVTPRAAIPGIPDSQNNICTDGGQICVDPDIMADNDWQCQCVAPKTGTAEQQALATCVDVTLAPTAVPPSATKNECEEISSAVTCNHKPRYTASGCQCACDWIATFKDAQTGMVIVYRDGPGSTTPCAGGCCNPNSEAGGDWCYPAANDFNTQRGCSRSRETCLAAGAVPATGGVPPRSTIPGIPDSQNNICTDGGQICEDPDPRTDDDWVCKCVAPKVGTSGQQQVAVCGVPTAAPTTVPTAVPTTVPADVPTTVPTAAPTAVPTAVPACAVGFFGYPVCTECTNPLHCNNRAGTVSSNVDNTGCECSMCMHQWTGAACDECLSLFSATADCKECAGGRITYPTCTLCTVEDHCSNQGTNVAASADKTSCECTCRNQWTGAACDECLSLFSATGDCKECAGGRITYPTCTLCTVEDHCSNQGTNVAASADKTSCECTCRNQWGGATCEWCPPGVDPYADCGECLPGHIGYPTCTPCNVDTHCNSHSETVASDVSFTECMCKCENQWTGSSCDVCASIYDQTTCDMCADGHAAYPTCTTIPTTMPTAVPTAVPTTVPGAVVPTAVPGAVVPTTVPGAVVPTAVPGVVVPTAVPGAVVPTDVPGAVVPTAVPGAVVPTAVPGAVVPTAVPGAVVPTAVPGAVVPTAVPGVVVPTAVPGVVVPTAVPGAVVPTAVPGAVVPTAVPGAVVPTAVPGAVVPTAVPGAVVPTAVPGAVVPTDVPGAVVTTTVPGVVVPTAVPGVVVPTAVPGAVVPTDVPGAVVPTAVPGVVVPTAVPGAVVPTDVPGAVVPTAVPGVVVPTAVPGVVVPTAVPGAVVPTAVPGAVVPTAVPGAVVPTAVPGAVVPTAVPGVVVPTAVPGAVVPTDVPGAVVPTAVPGAVVPTAVPGAVVPTAVPGAVVPTAVPGAVVPTAVPGAVVPTDVPGAVVPTAVPGVVVPTAVPGAVVPTDVPGAVVTTTVPGVAGSTTVPTAVPGVVVPTAVPGAVVPTAVPGAVVPTAVPGAVVPTDVPGAVVTTTVPGVAGSTTVPTAVPGVVVPTAVPGAVVPTAVPGAVVPTDVPGAVVTTTVPGVAGSTTVPTAVPGVAVSPTTVPTTSVPTAEPTPLRTSAPTAPNNAPGFDETDAPTTDAQEKDDSGTPWWVWVLIGLGILIVLLLGGMLLCSWRRGKGTYPPTVDSHHIQAFQPTSDSDIQDETELLYHGADEAMAC